MAAAIDEHIDKSEELPPKVVKGYTDTRRKRGELVYNNGGIHIPFPHAVDRLASSTQNGGLGILDEHQLYSAIEITLLHEVALKKLDVASLREFSHWFDWGEGPKHPETVYIRVMRKLPRADSSLIERICFQPVREADYAWIERAAHSIRTAFEALGDTLAAVRKALKQELEDEAGKDFEAVCKERYDTHLARQSLERRIKKP